MLVVSLALALHSSDALLYPFVWYYQSNSCSSSHSWMRSSSTASSCWSSSPYGASLASFLPSCTLACRASIMGASKSSSKLSCHWMTEICVFIRFY